MRIPRVKREVEPPNAEVLIPTDSSPPLGYTWEVVNLHIPICIGLERQALENKGWEYEARVTLNINVGSQNLYLFKLAEKVAFVEKEKFIYFGGLNFLFSETPPQALVIPSGQELSLRVELVIKQLKPEASESFPGVIVYSSDEFNEKNELKPVESSINYRYT